MERKLTAILSADVKGYSRLMGDDEEGTLHTLTAYRQLIDTLLVQYRGRFVGAAGDSVLAEFASVVDAVQCAVAIQTMLKAENARLPPDHKMEFRIGINLGDVLVAGDQIYGDGVNIAARVESLAEPGGICISGTVHEHIRNKLALQYEDCGEQQVKNIAEPVRVWRVRWEESDNQQAEDSASQKAKVKGKNTEQAEGLRLKAEGPPLSSPPTRFWPRKVFILTVGLLLLGAGLAVFSLSRPPLGTRNSELGTPAVLSLPDKPSLVVLPFTNMSEDPKQDYFSDGITEDLTTALSQIASLFVIARNSAFTYKGKAVKVQEVGKELGVQYILEGSVRRANDQVRITAQLVDAATDSHLWAQRYDRPLKDIFALQDEIVQKIVTTLKLQLTLREQGYLVRKTTDNLEAYDAYLRGIKFYNRATQETNIEARQLFEKALALDPQYAEAYTRLSRVLAMEWVYQWSQDPRTLERALVVAQKAVALDDSLSGAHEGLAYAYLYKRQHEQAIAAAERTITLAPNDSEGSARLGLILNFAGRPEEAIGLINKAMHLNPRYPYNYLSQLGMAYGLTGRYEEALATLRSATIRNPDHLPPHLHLALSYNELGRDAEARAEVAELLRISPNFSLEGFRRVMPFKNPADLERYLAALRKAGLK